MKHIGDLFSRYKVLIKPPQASVIKEFILVCKEVSGIDVSAEQFEYKVSSKTIYIKTHSLIKSELLQRKEAILSELSKKMGTNSPKQIL